MIDSATGVKVRLRLGVHSDQDGEKLAIFYKLFTSRPVIDLCASSPRQDSFTITNVFHYASQLIKTYSFRNFLSTHMLIPNSQNLFTQRTI